MNARGQEWHCLDLVLEFDTMLGRSNLLPVLAILAVDHLPNPLNNTEQVAC